MLTLWGRLSSVNVQKVVWCAGELGLDIERKEAGGEFGVVGTPEFRAMNPNGLVPVLVEADGFTLWESNAILRYLAAKHDAGGLWPSDLRVRADADRWMDWQAMTLMPAMGPAFHGFVRTPEDRRDHAAVETARERTEALFAILEVALEGRDYVAGDRFTMGDIPIGCAVHRWMNMPVPRPRRPAVERYYDRVRARSAADAALLLPLR